MDYMSKKSRNIKYFERKNTREKQTSNAPSTSNLSFDMTNSTSSDSTKASSRKRTSKLGSPTKDLQFLKSVVVSNDNMDLIRQKLQSTVLIRSEKMKESKLDFLEQYPIFFTHPTLVI